ncbi:hypothetical protein ABVC73_01825 [Prevotella melaninogenica]
MITIVGKMFNWKNEGLKHKSKSSMFNVQRLKRGSSEIWSDKASLLHIKGTKRGREHGGESRQSHGCAEGTKSDRGVVYALLITLVINVLRNLANHCFVMK